MLMMSEKLEHRSANLVHCGDGRRKRYIVFEALDFANLASLPDGVRQLLVVHATRDVEALPLPRLSGRLD